jgi:hypothetical protein
VIKWSKYLATDPEVPSSIPGHYKKNKVVGLERGPLSLVSATEELLGSNSSGSGLESREYRRRDSSRRPRGTLYPQKVGTNIVPLRTGAKEFFFYSDRFDNWLLS